jgi:hypothetical protein
MLAPIALFTYKRPAHTLKTLKYLRDNIGAEESTLFVFCDGPKLNASSEDIKNIDATRNLAKSKKWCKEVHIIERESNLGLAGSIIAGVTEIVNRYGNVIVVEDDVLLSPFFLKFMNDALLRYKEDEKVIAIGSWNYFCQPQKIHGNFFLRYPDSIAWATFARAWKLFEPEGNLLLRKLEEKGQLNYFNADGASPYFEKMLKDQVSKKIDSWSIRWTATAALHGMYTFFPQVSLSKHIGFGKGATHETGEFDYNQKLKVANKPIELKDQPVQEDPVAFEEWKSFSSTGFLPKQDSAINLKEKFRKLLFGK